MFADPANNDDRASDIVAYPSGGKFIVAGSTEGIGGSDFAVVRYNSDGNLDASFGVGGMITIDFGGWDTASSVAIDSSNRVLVAGTQNGIDSDFAVARLTDAGQLDLTFGSGGKQTVDFGDFYIHDIGYGVAVDSNDRVLVAGYSSDVADNTDFAVARLTTNGVLDLAFDTDGKQTISFSGVEGDIAYSVAVDSANRVIAAGNDGTGNLAVARLTTTGALDANFDGDGKTIIDFGGNDNGYSVAVDSADRVIVGGSSYQDSIGAYDFTVARLTSTGALDITFDADGKQTVSFDSDYENGRSVDIDSADRVLIAGWSQQSPGPPGSTQDFAVARLTSGGTLDATFGTNGKQTIAADITQEAAIAVDSVGRVLLLGTDPGTTNSDFSVVRLTTNGAIDLGFSQDGYVTTDIGTTPLGSDDSVSSVAYQSDGRFVVAGTANFAGTGRIGIVRYNADGSLDTTFGNNGILTTDFGGTEEAANSVAIDSVGRVLVAGWSYQEPGGFVWAVARFTASGERDVEFGDEGVRYLDFGGEDDGAYSVAIDSTNRVVVAGYSWTAETGNVGAVARLTADGDLDTTFGGGQHIISFGGDEAFYSVGIDGDDRVLVAGSSFDSATSTAVFTVARLTASGVLDENFDDDGMQTVDFDVAGQHGANSVAVDSSGRVVLAGTSYQMALDRSVFAIARLTTDGSLDGDFSDDGRQTVILGDYDIGQGMALDAAGRIVVAGYSYRQETAHDFAVVRLTIDGALDTTFGTDGKRIIDFGSDVDYARSMVLDSVGGVVIAGTSDQVTTGSDFAIARLEGYGLSVVGTPDDDDIWIGLGTQSGTLKTVINTFETDNIPVDGDVFVAGLDGNDTITVTGSLPGGIILAGQSGSDDYSIQFGSLAGTVRVVDDGAAGTDTLTANGTGDDEMFDKSVDPVTGRRTINRSAPTSEQIVADGIEDAIVDGGDGDDHITDPGANTIIRGGLGNDTILINATFGSGVTTDGGEGSDAVIVIFGAIEGTVEVVDTGTNPEDLDELIVRTATIDNAFAVTDSEVTWGALAEQNLTYSSIANLTVETGTGTNSVEVSSTGAADVTISAQGGTDSYIVQLGDLESPVTVANPTSEGTVSVAIVGTSDDDALSLSGNTIESGAGETIQLDTPVTEVAVDGGAGNDQITVSGLTAEVPTLSLDGGEGDNTFTLVDVGSSPVTELEITGGTDGGNNQVVIEGQSPPVVTIQQVAPQNVAVDSLVSNLVVPVGSVQTFATASAFTDPDVSDTHSAVWTFTHLDATGALVTETRPGTVVQGSGSGTVSNNFSFAQPGVYKVTLTIADDHGGVTNSGEQMFVVYDPSAGFVTGGGWITSPVGADQLDPAATGRANFGFISQYKKGATTPTGQTEFQFQAGNLNFKSTSYEWLVVAGARAQYKGEGTINGVGSYRFMLTAIDGQINGGGGVDKFRIKIWEKDSGGLRYDNQLNADDGAAPTTALGGGQIVIHSGGKNLVAETSHSINRSGVPLTPGALDAVVDQAADYWAARGYGREQVAGLKQLDVQIASLPGSLLGIASSSTNVIWIDADAAGHGWSLSTEDFRTGGFDLLSTLMHEYGHMLGLDHDVLGSSLHVGERHLATLAEHHGLHHLELDLPLSLDFGSPTHASMLAGNTGSAVAMDAVDRAPLSRGDIGRLDVVMADWSHLGRSEFDPTEQFAYEPRPSSSLSRRSQLETDQELPDDLLGELAAEVLRLESKS